MEWLVVGSASGTLPGLRPSKCKRNGRLRGGDTFDLEGLAGGQTRWRERKSPVMTQCLVTPFFNLAMHYSKALVLHRRYILQIWYAFGWLPVYRDQDYTKIQSSSGSARRYPAGTGGTSARMMPLVPRPSFDSQPRGVHVEAALEAH